MFGGTQMRCTFQKDDCGLYITPLLGVSKVKGIWKVWTGWLWWLFTWEIYKEKKC